jgi:hypothetical protein
VVETSVVSSAVTLKQLAETDQFFTVSLRPFIYVENKIFPYAVTLKRKAIS